MLAQSEGDSGRRSGRYAPVAGRCDEVEHGMDTVVPEARVTLDTRLLCQNVVILPLEEADNLRETGAYRVSADVGLEPHSEVSGVSHLASLST